MSGVPAHVRVRGGGVRTLAFTARKDRARLWRNAAPSHFILLVAVALIGILLLVTR